MFFEKLETEIVARLKHSLGNSVDVELEPENEAANKVPFAKPRVTTMFDQSTFEKQASMQYVSQHETAQLAIYIRSRTLRGANGVYAVAEECRRSIVGFAPSDYSKIWMLKFTFVKREDNLFHYALLIATKCVIAEDATLETGPPFKQGENKYVDPQYQ